MRKYLKDRKHYEDLYDRHTVEEGRREVGKLARAREEFYQKAKVTVGESHATEFWWTRIYWWLVELPTLLPRWENRDTTIQDWMARDRQLDERLGAARPHIEPTCTDCGKQGLKLKLKELLHRGSGSTQEVLFMFDCLSCKKRSAYWEDGTEWVSPVLPCPRCDSPLVMDVKVRGQVMATTYSCEKCTYKDTERVRMDEKSSQDVDPDYERDKKSYCLNDKRARTMQEYRIKWNEGMRMLDAEMEREARKDVYEAASQIMQLKIPQLMDKLRQAIEKAGFIELSFDKPDLGRDVIIGFGCMDGKSDREDAKSRKALKRTVDITLADSNWRLMSDGVDYRLGYLSGRLRAYEHEEDLVRLVSKH